MLLTNDNMLAAVEAKGAIPFFLHTLVTTATAATVASGYVGFKHYTDEFIMPSSLPAGVPGYFLGQCEVSSNINQATPMACLQYNLATLTGASTFASGVTMPIKAILGQSIQTNAMLCVVRITTTFTGSVSPVIVITYTNQDGTSGRTATLTLPSNPTINSCYLIAPHLQSGDTAIRSVQAITRSTGTVGALVISGLLPMHIQPSTINAPGAVEPLGRFAPRFLAEANETIAFYSNQNANATSVMVNGFLIPEVN